MNFNTKKQLFSFILGASKNIIQASIFFIEFVLYLPEWTSGDKNLYNRQNLLQFLCV